MNKNASSQAAKNQGPSRALAGLLDILNLEERARDCYRGISPRDGWQRVYGGQVLGQALAAASRTVDARFAHSLHAYFMRPGNPAKPIDYEVERIRDGKSFTTRRVIARQDGVAIFSMSASFQIEESGFEHQMQMPDAPPPEELMDEEGLKELLLKAPLPEHIKRYWQRERPIEWRFVNFERYVRKDKLPPVQAVWLRSNGPLPPGTALRKCVLAYMSDMTLLDTSLFPHGRSIFSPHMQVASLDHAMWFHHPFRADEWMLYAQDSPSASGARGFARGSFFTREGKLIASTAQEGLIRIRA